MVFRSGVGIGDIPSFICPRTLCTIPHQQMLLKIFSENFDIFLELTSCEMSWLYSLVQLFPFKKHKCIHFG